MLTEQVRRRSSKQDRLLAARLELYTDLLEVAARLADNAMTWSALPSADLVETDNERLDRILARVRLLARDDVRSRMAQFSKVVHEFNPQLYHARDVERLAQAEGAVGSAEAIRARMRLGDLADQLRALHHQLEAAVRKEVR
jgi:hypothetical protein